MTHFIHQTWNKSTNPNLGASAYGVCNNNILAVISNYMGKLGVIALKSATKRLTAKEKEILEDKKMNKKQKDETKKLKKMKKNGKFDHEDEVDEEDGDSESDTDQSNEKESFSQFTQLSQLSQPFDEEEEIEVSSYLFDNLVWLWFPYFLNDQTAANILYLSCFSLHVPTLSHLHTYNLITMFESYLMWPIY